MSNIGSKIERLIADGFSYNTLRGLSESQVNLLYNRLVENITQQDVVTLKAYNDELRKTQDMTSKMGMAKEEMSEDAALDQIAKIDPYAGNTPGNEDGPSKNDGYNKSYDGMSEGEISEKFESKRQQKYFWWKCNSSKSEKAKEKWCKWAKEFSDKTNFKKLPEKAESVKKLEESLTKLVEKYIPESISKKDLMDLIESSTRTKEAPERAPKEKEKDKEKPKTKNPFRIKELPAPKGKKEIEEGGSAAPAKAPGRTKEKEKEKQKPSRKNPFKIEPAQKPGPKGRAPKWLNFDTFTKLGYNLK